MHTFVLQTILFRLSLLLVDVANVDCGFRSRFRWVFLFVQIRASNGQRATVVTESQGGHRCVVMMELAESLLVESVPNVDESIGATCWKKNYKY